jgi:voltage-gated potassium channel
MKYISTTLIKLAYLAQASSKYKNIKRSVYNFLESNNFRYRKAVDFFMMFLIFSSIFIMVRDVKSPENDYLYFFNHYVITFIFLIEYLLRFWVYNDSSKIIIEQLESDRFLNKHLNLKKSIQSIISKKIEFMTSPRAIIDLLAIMPFFHELRLLRIFILFRVFKLFRYTRSIQEFFTVLKSKKFEFIILISFIAIVVFISGVMIYVMEANNPNSPIDTLFEAFYWSLVTISTVGYGDLVPVTEAGQVVAMLIIVSGIAVISFSTSIVVSAFSDKLEDIRNNKTISDISKLKDIFLICGYNALAYQVALKLKHKNENVVIIDNDEENIKEARKHSLIAMNLDPSSLQTYKSLEIDFNKDVKAVISLYSDDVLNVYTALTIRSFNKKIKLISLLIQESHRKKLSLCGVDKIVYPQELVGLMVKEYSGRPVAFETIHELRSESQSINIQEIKVDKSIYENSVYVKDMHVKDYKIILLGIYKEDLEQFLFNPIDSTLIEPHDILLVIGHKKLINEFNINIHKKISR